jgi:hypothetical protein
MVSLHGYFDESGKSHQHGVVVFSGFVSPSRYWDQLCDDWEILLRGFRLPSLRFAEHKRETEMMKQFVRAIKRNVELGISVAVDAKEFEKLPEQMRVRIGNDPYYLAFKCVVFEIINRVCSAPGSTLAFTCDEDEQTTRICLDWYKQLKREDPEARARLASFCIADDKQYPQLQAADVFAGINRPEAEHRILHHENPLSGLFQALQKQEPDRRLDFRTLMVDRKSLQDFATDWKAALKSHVVTEPEL